MTTTADYQGWTNYETWAVNLIIGNDQSSHLYWMEAAREMWANHTRTPDAVLTHSEAARFSLSDQIKDEITDAAPELDSPYAELLSAAISEVNWDEIADGLLSARGADGYEAAK